ncbi:bifunctional diguanylate cyclase/phosphodiesterase [Rhizobium sp. SAFR-030]|uniref:bifunctional diguanylate cyclase/phosphodiesterase n=1 Tax=Rhizobium sp. SAFR-030 TaxID=3387277 RepID=UPI003F821E69
MQDVYSCLREAHDQYLLAIAAIVCIVGVYASFSIARHASRAEGPSRRTWAGVAILAAGCTAWATHMIGLLAFQPGMLSGFEPLLTAASLLFTIIGIGIAVATAIGRRNRLGRMASGLLLGCSIILLHYLGQSAFIVTGHVSWNTRLIGLSIVASLPLFAVAMVIAGEKRRALRRLAAPLLVVAVAVLHFAGMAALQLEYDPRIQLPESAISPDVIAPIVASVSAGLVLLAFVGLRFALAARAQQRRDQLRLKQLADLAVEGLLICEDDIIQATNSSFSSLAGFRQEDAAGRPVTALIPGFVASELDEGEEQDASLNHADGRSIPVRILRKTVAVGARQQTIIAVRDQSERLRTESRMHALAYFDDLTGLSNRQRFNEILQGCCHSTERDGHPFALLLLDLDRFKSVNDTLGHVTGDQLLTRVAKRICACVGEADVVARLGGDEFAVIVRNAEHADRTAGMIADLLERPFLIDGSVIDVTSSIGIAVAPRDGCEPTLLSRHADLALYAAKHGGGASFRHFEKEMSERAQARRALELDLRRALAREEFDVHYQPQVDPGSGAYQGAEALVRWQHPVRGMVAPADFIPLAEEIGVIGALGEWVLRTACLEATAWPDHISIAVNLSPLQLRDSNFTAIVANVLRETGLSASRLELEITESALLQDGGTAYRILHELRAMDIHISMDDFGTGYSSLSYLRRFPFTKIKIDQSFVRQVPEDRDAVAIVQAITSLAAKLNMTVTVEGVETTEQRDFTIAEGCNQIQGYLISRPVERSVIRSLFSVADKAVA